MTSKITTPMSSHNEIPLNIMESYYKRLEQGMMSYKIKFNRAPCKAHTCGFEG